MERRAVCLPVKFDSMISNPYATLLESLYASLWNHEGFESFLGSLKCHANSTAAALMVISRNSGQMNWGWTVGISENFKRWHQKHKDADIHQLESLGGESEGFIAASLMLGNEDLIDSVADTLKPWFLEKAIVDAASLAIKYSENEYLLLALIRNDQEGKFNECDIDQLNFLAPFIKRTAQLYVKLHRQQKMNDALIGAVRSLSQATIVLNETMEVQHINPAAEALLENCSIMTVVGNNLVIDEPHLYEQLRVQVAELTHLSEQGSLSAPITLTIPQGRQSISITLTAVAGKNRDKNSKTVLLQIFQPNQQMLKADYIQELLRISQAEAAVCQLLIEGYNLKEMARMRGVSIHTVREQIRQIYLKTGYKRQQELVAAIYERQLNNYRGITCDESVICVRSHNP